MYITKKTVLFNNKCFQGFFSSPPRKSIVGMELATWMKLSSTMMRGRQDSFQKNIIKLYLEKRTGIDGSEVVIERHVEAQIQKGSPPFLKFKLCEVRDSNFLTMYFAWSTVTDKCMSKDSKTNQNQYQQLLSQLELPEAGYPQRTSRKFDCDLVIKFFLFLFLF